MQFQFFRLTMYGRVSLDIIKICLQGLVVLNALNVIQKDLLLPCVVMSVIVAWVRLNHFFDKLVRIYHFLHKLNVLWLVERNLVAKRVLRVNMHVVNSMNACVSNPMKNGILREMERLELEIFFDIDVKLL